MDRRTLPIDLPFHWDKWREFLRASHQTKRAKASKENTVKSSVGLTRQVPAATHRVSSVDVTDQLLLHDELLLNQLLLFIIVSIYLYRQQRSVQKHMFSQSIHPSINQS